MWNHAKQARLDQISAELLPLTQTKSLSDAGYKRMNALTDEGIALAAEKDTHSKAAGYASFASPNEWDGSNPGVFNDGSNPGGGIAFQGIAPGMDRRIRPVSLYEMDKTQLKALQQSAQQGMGLRIQIGSKGIEHGNFAGLRTKSAVTEGGLTPNLLPPIQQVGDRGWYSLPYEPQRVANWLPNVAMDGPGIAYFSHTANAAEAAYTAEAGTKPDTTPTVTENYIRPAKVAGRVNITHELLQDAGDQFSGYLQTDLARSVYNAESNLLLNGTSGANGFNGINEVSGTLTRAAAIGSGDTDALDTLNKAFVDLRSDFFEPDLVFMSPATLGSIRRLRDLNNRPQLDLLAGARAINQTNDVETLWGVPIVTTTQQADGTAAVLSVQNGAAVVYVREALVTFFDPYSQIANNIYQFVAETRIALAVPRPHAINLVSGLPTT